MPESQQDDVVICPCCKKPKSRTTVWRHMKAAKSKAQAQAPIVLDESLPPPKRRRIAHFQADAGSSSSGHMPSFDPGPPPLFLDPPADLDLPQLPGDARTVPPRPRRFFDDALLGLHVRTHRNPDDSNDEDSEDAPEEVAVEDPELIDPRTDDFWNEEDADMEDEVDPREGVVSDWDILAENFIAEAEEFGTSVHSSLHTP